MTTAKTAHKGSARQRADEEARQTREVQRLQKQLDIEITRARRVMTEALSSMYRAAGDSRLRQDLRGPKGSSDHVAWRERDKLVNVSKALLAQSPVYAGFVDRMIDYTIGTGLEPVGEGENTPADEAVKLFNQWAERCDVRAMDDFGELQRKALREMLAFGDMPVIQTIKQGEQALQLVPSELLQHSSKRPPNTKAQRGRPRSAEGIDLDESGAPVTYHISSYDPTGGTVTGSPSTEVPAERVIFLAWRTFAGMTRGMPWLAAAMERFIDLNEFCDAVLQAAKLQAALAILVTSKTPGAVASKLRSGAETTTGSDGTQKVDTLGDVTPGQILTLPHGDDAKAIQGSQPNATFESFIRSIILVACAGAGLPIEIAIGDFSKANFSVSRMARIAACQTARPMRKLMERFCRRVFAWRIDRLIADGVLKAALREEYLKVRWQAPAMVPIDPEAEARAAILEIDNNLTTKKDVLGERGRDPQKVFPQRAQEKQQERELGIEPPMTPGAKTESAGTQTPGDTGKPEPDDDEEEDVKAA